MSEEEFMEFMQYIMEICEDDPSLCEDRRRAMPVYEDVHIPANRFHPSMDVIEPVLPNPGWLSPPWEAPRPRVVETIPTHVAAPAHFAAPIAPVAVAAPVARAPVRHW
jgi:hypothetical protein